jgi:hypothetical protein
MFWKKKPQHQDAVQRVNEPVVNMAVMVIEEAIRTLLREAETEFTTVQHTTIIPGPAENFKFHRYCYCKNHHRTEFGEKYTILGKRRGAYRLHREHILYANKVHEFWYGQCPDCLTVYWESHEHKAAETYVVIATE